MVARVVTVRNPFNPSADRDIREVPAGATLEDLAPKLAAKPFVVLLNGEAVLRAGWSREVAPGDVVAVVFLPRGGGGGGSDPLRMVLSIALMVVTGPIGESLAWSAFDAGLVTDIVGFNIVSAVASGALNMLGSALINAMIGTPSNPSSIQAANAAAPSPTYNLGAQGNIARLDQAIPVQYGRVCGFPDFASRPYIEYQGNEQYLFMLLCVGAGEYDIEQIRIEDTPLSSWEEITTETIGPHAACTLFPTNVDTSEEVSGQEMTYNVYLGGFNANPAGTAANALGLDFVFPRGIYYANDAGGLDNVTITWTVEARTIDGSGTPTGSWVTLGNETITAGTATPQRVSKRYSVTAGRYQVRVKRTSTKQTDSRYGNDIDWAGLRAYLPETRDFGDVTLIAVKARASNNLSSQASRKINVIATRRLPAWNGSAFGSASATRSIAWALANICVDSTWGAGLPESRVDLDGLLALDAVWTARGDKFDGRFDQTITFWEAIQKIARAGRAYAYMQGGVIRFARDAAETVPVALYSTRNIVRGSFKIQYLTPSEAMADAVEVAYYDEAVWQSQRVQAAVSGSSAAKPAKVDLFGVVQRDQAFREGVFEAACNKYRRKLITFTTELEGFIPSFGDLVAIAHDLPQWGQTSEAAGWDAGARILTLSEPVAFTSGTHYVALRKRDGSVDGPIVATAGVDAYHVVLASAPSFSPYVGDAEERTHIAFGPGETWRQPARVIGIRPRGLDQVVIECVNEDPAVHTAESGLTPPAASYSQLPTRYTAPEVVGLVAWSMPDHPEQIIASWQPAPGADHYLVEQSNDGITWTAMPPAMGASYTGGALYGAATILRIAAVGLTRGPWTTVAYGSLADYMWTGDANNFWSTNSALMWRY